MKYIIERKNKCLFVDDDKEQLMDTLIFIGFEESDIKEVEDDEIELAYDGCYYLKGFAPIQPTDEYNEQQSQNRSEAYIKQTDPLTLRKMRKLALNEWTEEDEAQYIAEIQRISQEIDKEFPYREPIETKASEVIDDSEIITESEVENG